MLQKTVPLSDAPRCVILSLTNMFLIYYMYPEGTFVSKKEKKGDEDLGSILRAHGNGPFFYTHAELHTVIAHTTPCKFFS